MLAGRTAGRKNAGNAVKPKRDGAATRKAILETAERLFAQKGFDGTSIREIKDACNIEVGLVNYHFGSKENLFREVLMMRADEINAQRLKLLDLVETSPNDIATVTALIEAFLQPYSGKTKAASRRLSSCRKLLALTANSRRWQGEVMEYHFNSAGRKLATRLQEALPGVAEADIFWTLSFLAGAMFNAYAETKWFDRLSAGQIRSDDTQVIQAALTRFMVDGLMRLAAQAAAAPPQRPPSGGR